jgi:hypothetical protein
MQELIDAVFSIQSKADFERCALEVYQYQRKNVPVYKEFVDLLKRPEPTTVAQIPFLPISFFKTHRILAEGFDSEVVFKSSGTTGMIRSQHFVAQTALYVRSFLPTFEQFVGKCSDTIIFALLPNYIEQGESSLVYMVDRLIQETKDPLSGFYLEQASVLLEAIQAGRKTGKRMILFGVSYALLDLAELQPDLSDLIIIETGGMKGRRKEMTKEELHTVLKVGFSTDFISSEYGMSELLSQAYSDREGLFETPPWMKVLLREVNDPFTQLEANKTGGVNVIDLANPYSCSFIETQDLGRMENEKFRLLGRFDHSDVRGCNLLVS